ncbi:TRAP transporter permease [Oceanobacillus jeddahense]|uniref:TRAP transporter permease n=1 Tax=Oceanobacillus jeddahense TaxID=1462527 RepID=UPI0009448A45|nr:TRAP transporter fused permease subunit [Oceanobacillus jeddahense]
MKAYSSRTERVLDKCLQVIPIIFVIGLISYMFGIIPPEAWHFETFAVMIILTLGYEGYIRKELNEKKLVYSLVSFLIYLSGISSCIYLFFEIPRLEWFYGSVWNNADIIFGTLLIIALLDLTRRKFGWPLPSIAAFFLLYSLFGHYLPSGYFGHSGFSYGRIISFLYSPAGIFGIVFKTFISIIFIFMLFGTFLQKTGVGQFLVDLSFAIAGKFRGGPAKVAVVASAVLGSINGNSVANVATTGAITIPLMKRTGYKPAFAGGVEAAASTGGQILPPIMGAGAFIMAEFLSIDYQTVVVAAIVPALLYFIAIFLIVDLEAVKNDLKGLTEIPKLTKVLKHFYLGLPIVVLIYSLLIANFSVARSGVYAILACIIISWFTKDHRMGIKRISESTIKGTNDAIGIGVLCATAGIVIGTVSMTGFGNQFSSAVVNLAGDNLFLVAILTAVMAIILGMGLPTTAAYIISMAVAVPALTTLDIPPLSAHLFVFYFAVVSAITPPIGAAFYTAASIAKAGTMETGFQAVRIGIGAFTVPFFFIISPALLLDGPVDQIILGLSTAILGIIAVAMAFQGVTFFGNKIYLWQSLLLLISFVLLIYPSQSTDIYGAILFFIVFLIGFIILRNRTRNKEDDESLNQSKAR